MIQSRTKHEQGFTLIELLLSLSFVAFLLLFIVFAMVQVMNDYSKGLAIKNINQTARSTVEEVSRQARGIDASAINANNTSEGRLCLGNVSYIWNINSANTNKFASPATELLTLVRIDDAGGVMCKKTNGNFPDVPQGEAAQLLSGDIWVQSMDATVSTNQKFVTIDLRLSTVEDNAPSVDDPQLGKICGGDKNSQYCAVGTFSTTVTTRNGGQ